MELQRNREQGEADYDLGDGVTPDSWWVGHLGRTWNSEMRMAARSTCAERNLRGYLFPASAAAARFALVFLAIALSEPALGLARANCDAKALASAAVSGAI